MTNEVFDALKQGDAKLHNIFGKKSIPVNPHLPDGLLLVQIFSRLQSQPDILIMIRLRDSSQTTESGIN